MALASHLSASSASHGKMPCASSAFACENSTTTSDRLATNAASINDPRRVRSQKKFPAFGKFCCGRVCWCWALFDDDDEDEDEDSEEDSEEEEEEEERLARPSFVPKAQRATIFEAMEQERLAKERKERAAAAKAARAQESRAIVAEAARRSDVGPQKKDDDGSEVDAPDDADDEDDAEEIAQWRAREVQRTTRDLEQRRAAEVETRETERRRNLTPEERRREDEADGKFATAPKAKWKFLQKYHHKGAFFMDDETLTGNARDVRNRSTDGATGVDKFDRSKLPAVLQVKDFGFAGRTKYTHLVDQDTTFLDRDYEFNGWTKTKNSTNPIRRKYDAMRAGVGDIDRPFDRRRSSRGSCDKRKR
mmetsp:Transcript_11363/g.34002  ORF Transcript_11363/g.34002 Transcript_11363/m.34002 type:complete len:363 (-) Transcript_11363:113-1201(-)